MHYWLIELSRKKLNAKRTSRCTTQLFTSSRFLIVFRQFFTHLFIFSLSYYQARSVHPGYDTPNVQDLGVERPHLGVHPVGAVLGWDQIERHASDAAGPSLGSVLLIHIKVKGTRLCPQSANIKSNRRITAAENLIEAATSTQHI
jgi:hypothetical protein